MWTFKACPRCGGDCFIDRDRDGWYEQCLQCGHTLWLATLVHGNEAEAGEDKYGARALENSKAWSAKFVRR